MAWQNVFLTKRLSQDADEMSSWQFVFLTKRLLTANYAFFCGYSLKFQQIGWCKRFYKYPVRTKPTTGSKYRNVTKTHRFVQPQTIHNSIQGNLWQEWSDSKSTYLQTRKGSSWANPEVGEGANQDFERAGNNSCQQNTILTEKKKQLI